MQFLYSVQHDLTRKPQSIFRYLEQCGTTACYGFNYDKTLTVRGISSVQFVKEYTTLVS